MQTKETELCFKAMLGLLCLCAVNNLARATPAINLPINAQVPPVARIDQSFHFTFSQSTFTSASDEITYTLSNAPPWLTLDGPSRTFSGTPGQDNSGSIVVDLVADDNAGAVIMPITLVIDAQAGPEVGWPVATQLPAFGPFSSPSSILLAPSSALSISLSSMTFGETNNETVYYAISSDHTPLPSWIHFDPSSLTFSGTTPQIDSSANTSQSFGIELTASNVVGFADATTGFLIVIEDHLLSFNTNAQILNITAGSPLNDSTLLSTLSMDGRQATSSDIKQVVATPPAWLSLNSQTLSITGSPPKDFLGQNFTIAVIDIFGDSASTMVVLQPLISSTTSLLNPIGTANATAGSEFVYYLSQTINVSDVELVVDLGTASAWLIFESSTKTIKGHVPSDLKPQQLVVNITAWEESQSQSEILTIAVQNSTFGLSPRISPIFQSGEGPTDKASTTASPLAQHANAQRAWLPAAIVLPLALLSGLASLVLICWRRGRRRRLRGSFDDQSNASSQDISQPIMTEKDSRTPRNATNRNVSSKRASSRFSLAPRIPQTWTSAVGKRSSKNRASDLSFGDRAQRPDSWQTYRAGLVHPEDRDIEGFSRIPEEPASNPMDKSAKCIEKGPMEVATQIATKADASPPRTHSKRKRDFSSMSLPTSTPFYGPALGGFGHGKADPSGALRGVMFGDRAGRYENGLLGRGPPGFRTVHGSWRNHRRESIEGLTDTSEVSSDKHVLYGARDPYRRQYTIRPVQPSAAFSLQDVDHWTKTPPLTRNLKTFRPRRSTNPFLSAGSLYSENLRQTSSKSSPENSWLSTSLESRTFPRIVDQDDDPRYKSAVPSEAQSMYERDTHEDSSDDQKYESHSSCQDPLRASPIDRDNVQAGLSAAMYAGRRKSRPWDALTHKLNQQIEQLDSIGRKENDSHPSDDRSGTPEDDSYVDDDATVASQSEPSVNVQMITRGKRLDRQMGMRQDDPGNRSMRGEIKQSGSSSFL